ncbi:MAG TPA: TIGR03435 family protein [Bryobacteraceae bacterium]|nr:TIGR03435 family protein [Bryobacteraceae bacterium]
MTLWIAALAVAAQVSSLAAQVSSFEVASVKPVNPQVGPHVVSLIVNHGRLNIEAAELRQIVGLAYAVQRVRVQGGPGWADSDQFDIVAKANSPDATRDEIRSMLQTLLAERFKLIVHRETKQVPAYSLVLARSGSKLKEAAQNRKSGMANTVSSTGEQLTVFESSPLRILVNMLANTLGGPVVDKTGLDKLYDYTFQWPNADSSLFASLEQLGLKLEAKKEPVEVLVMDRAEHPSAN